MDFLLTLILALTLRSGVPLPATVGDLDGTQLRPAAATSEPTPPRTQVGPEQTTASACELDCPELRPSISPGG